jgi:hypothetical protein
MLQSRKNQNPSIFLATNWNLYTEILAIWGKKKSSKLGEFGPFHENQLVYVEIIFFQVNIWRIFKDCYLPVVFLSLYLRKVTRVKLDFK